MVNNICNRIIRHWKENKQILPEFFDLDPARVREVIDGIENEHQTLLNTLEEYAEPVNA